MHAICANFGVYAFFFTLFFEIILLFFLPLIKTHLGCFQNNLILLEEALKGWNFSLSLAGCKSLLSNTSVTFSGAWLYQKVLNTSNGKMHFRSNIFSTSIDLHIFISSIFWNFSSRYFYFIILFYFKYYSFSVTVPIFKK